MNRGRLLFGGWRRWVIELGKGLSRGEDGGCPFQVLGDALESCVCLCFGVTGRFSRDRPRFTDTLDVIKFLCKDMWTLVFRKQIDNLKTNHRVWRRIPYLLLSVSIM